MNEEDIEDGVFEEIIERDVILTKDLSEEDLKKVEEAEAAEPSIEDAAAFAAEMEAEINKEKATLEAPAEERPLTQQEMMQAISSASKQGVLSKSRKTKMLQEMGIFQSTFTKKAVSKPAKAKKRKAAKKARRKNRK